MKRFIKQYEKYLNLRHYITILRRQPMHVRHVYAAFFSGVITLLLAASILYFDYGFWHETYVRGEVEIMEKENNVNDNSEVETRSPKEMLGDFFNEAGDKLKNISISSTTLPTGKDTYRRE